MAVCWVYLYGYGFAPLGDNLIYQLVWTYPEILPSLLDWVVLVLVVMVTEAMFGNVSQVTLEWARGPRKVDRASLALAPPAPSQPPHLYFLLHLILFLILLFLLPPS